MFTFELKNNQGETYKFRHSQGTIEIFCEGNCEMEWLEATLYRLEACNFEPDALAGYELEYNNEKAILETLAAWGSNPGDIEEIAAELASTPETIFSASATVYDGHIEYQLELTKTGIEMYENWCAENGHHINLKGKGNVLIFEDENAESIRNTMADWEEAEYKGWLLGQITQVADSQTDFAFGFDHLFRFMSENPKSETTKGFIEYHQEAGSPKIYSGDADFTYLIGKNFIPEDWVDESDMEAFQAFVQAQK